MKLNNGQRSAGIMTCDEEDSHKLWVKMRCNMTSTLHFTVCKVTPVTVLKKASERC